MTTETVTVTASSAVSNFQFWETIRWDLPAVVLVVALLVYGWSIYKTQTRADFDFADMYKGDDGKPSTGRVIAVGAWVISSWVLMQDIMDATPTPELFWAYVIAWSAAKPLEKAAEKWTGTLPWSK